MKKKKKRSILKKKPRAAAKNKRFTPRRQAIRWDGSKKPQGLPKVIAKEMAAYGVYEKLLLTIQNGGKWAQSTCTAYDRLALRSLLPLYPAKPYSQLSDTDFEEIFDKIHQQQFSLSKKRSCVYLLRLLHDAAVRNGYSSVLLTIPDELEAIDIPPPEEAPSNNKAKPKPDPDAEYPEGPELEKDRREGKADARKRLNNNDYIPLAKIVMICLLFIDYIEHNGVYFAAIFVFLLGMRPSEALAFKFKDIIQIGGIWCLPQLEILGADSRESHVGNKTKNGYRYIPIPDFLVDILQKRKAHLSEIFGPDAVEEMPISCRLSEYRRQANQAELREAVQAVFQEVKLGELAERDLKCTFDVDSETFEECEGYYTTYLGRHFTANGMVSIGMPIDLLQMGFGHKIEHSELARADANNPDLIKRLKLYWSQLPIIQILSRDRAIQSETIGAEKLLIQGDRIELDIPESGDYSIQITANSYGDVPDIQFEGCEPVVRLPTELNMLEYTCEQMNKNFSLPASLREQFLSGSYPIPVFTPALADKAWLAERAEKIPFPDKELPFIYPVDAPKTASSAKHTGPQQKAASSNEDPLNQPQQFVDTCNLHLLIEDAKGKHSLHKMPGSSMPITPHSRNGKHITSFKGTIKQLIAWNADSQYLCILPDGQIRSVLSPEQLIAEGLENTPHIEISQATADGEKIVCLTKQGKLQITAFDALPHKADGKQLINLPDDDCVVSAAILAADEDLLVATTHGKAVRISHTNLQARKAIGSGPIAGVTCAPDDAPFCCLPYPTDGKLFAVTMDGYLAHISGEKQLMSHGRKSSPQKFIKPAKGDTLVYLAAQPEAVGILNNKNTICWIDTQSISSHQLPVRSSTNVKCVNRTFSVVPGKILR